MLGGRLRIGDKLMLSGRNLHELGLMNGTILRLLDHRDEKLIVTADGLIVELPDEEAPRLQLAYACSIHKGQGIELPVAIVVAHPAAGPYFLRREMLYTAMTRARVATLVVGQRGVVARAAATPDTSRRYSRLAVRLAARVTVRVRLGAGLARLSAAPFLTVELAEGATVADLFARLARRRAASSRPRCARCCRSWRAST